MAPARHRHRTRHRLALPLSLLLVLSWAVAASSPATAAAGSATATAPAGITVDGKNLLRDGHAFTPLGFSLVGLLTPPGCRKGNAGAHHLNQTEMNVAKKGWHANTLRFQVSYTGLTGYDAAERAQYLSQIKAAVELARTPGNDFAVILSLQDQPISCGTSRVLPPVGALGVWKTLAGVFNNWPYVMFELWNEPDNDAASGRLSRSDPLYAQRQSWPDWLDGRSTAIAPNRTKAPHWAPYIPTGHQQLVNAIRATGAKNVVMADGAAKGEHLDGLPLLSDPLANDQIAYATHMYYFQTGRADWDHRFGYLAAAKPVIMTEWDFDCSGTKAARQRASAPEFLAYLTEKHVGMTAWSLDVMDTLISDWNYTPTSATNCREKSGGLTVKNYFASFAGASQA